MQSGNIKEICDIWNDIKLNIPEEVDYAILYCKFSIVRNYFLFNRTIASIVRCRVFNTVIKYFFFNVE